jgi:aminoglycoside 2''-phosphotransferase
MMGMMREASLAMSSGSPPRREQSLSARLEAIDAEASRYRDAINTAFPTLIIERLDRLGEGWDSDVWLVNQTLVFRFPKRDDVVPWLQREILLLPELAPRLPLPIPQFRYVWPGRGRWPLPFVGYPKLEGVPFPRPPELPAGWPEMAAELGAFVGALHEFPVRRAEELEVPVHTPHVWLRAHDTLVRQIEAFVYPLVTALERRMLDGFFRRFLDLLGDARFTPVLVHGDLNYGHVLTDPVAGALTGVIDWGDMRVTDPALDFAGFPRQFGELMARAYGGRKDPTFAERARTYGRLEPFRGVLLGLDTQNRVLVNESLAAVRRDLRDA